MAPLTIVACHQTDLTKVSQPPVVSIETPVTGSAFDEGVPIPMRGRALDEDYEGQLDSLAPVWQVDGGRVCEDSVVDASGITDCEHVFVAGSSTITLTVTNPSGESATAQSDVIVNENAAPVATLNEPTADGLYYSNSQIVFAGTVSDVEDPAETLTVTWASSIDGELDIDGTPTSAGEVSGSILLSEGEHYLTMTVTDQSGRTGEDGVAITVSGENHVPDCSITAPETGYFAELGETVLFEGLATDQDIPSNELTATWTSDKDGEFGSSTPSSSGEFFYAMNALSTNTHAITLTVTDEIGAICTDTILVSVGNVPDVTIDLPLNGEVYNEGDTITFSGSVSDAEDRPTDLDLAWSSDLDGTFSTQGANSSGQSEFTYGGLSVGAHTITLTATDTDGFSSVDRATIYVNGLPTAPTVAITPDPATSADTLTASVTGASVDPDGDPVTYRYAWYQDGVLTAYATSTITSAIHARGETWEVRVYPSDGYGEGAFGTDSIVVGNGAPSATSVTISPTTAYTDDTLTAVPVGWSDPDGDAEGYRYVWYRNGSAISGAEDSTLAGTYFSKDDSMTVTVTPWDGTSSGSAITSGARVIQNSAPTAPVVAVIPERPEADEDLDCTFLTASTDADGDSISYTYSWKKNGAVTGETSATVSAASTANNETWECTVTPSDGTSTGSSGSDSVYVDDYTAPSAPVLTSLTPYRNEDSATITGTGEASTTITLYIVTSSGTTTQTTVSDGSGAFTFSLTGLTRGETYSFYATATDAEGNVSGASNTIGTEVCDPIDEYEDSSGYGDVCTDPIVDWSTLSDDGATSLTISGNLVDGTDSDWYLVQASDAVTGSLNYYRFHVEMTHGSDEYAFVVYEGGCTTSYLGCESGSSTDPEGDGYTEFERFAQDQGDGGHTIPSDTRSCSSGSASYNLCDDLSDDYYIHVIRKSTGYSCEYYELEVTNGVW